MLSGESAMGQVSGGIRERFIQYPYALAPIAGFSVRTIAFSPSTARKMTKPMPIGNNQSLAGIGAEWNHKFKNGNINEQQL